MARYQYRDLKPSAEAEDLYRRWLCHLDEEFVYEIALLHRDGRFVHVVMNAATGKFIGVRHGREPMSKM